ncbi:TIGR03086 family metal-binding protein [Streptomyces sp. JJ36]|uniref:TIGR03086 family metal-binding protein n=1 Tax=Streptomyces sp. JJ36 TaxID=2736645 RepID=UPI001F1A6ED5|nr:TIGR03086 family metal-binding protein [Streptomyces sp. JJ36]MCF6524580.1 TIGR03086 family protein [Streptomyces sp. JJ36]
MPETMPGTRPGLDAAAAEVAALLNGVDDGELGRPTPCPEYTVGDLLAHLMDLTLAFRDAAEKAGGPTAPPDPSAARLDPRWRVLLPARLDALAAAWRDPAAWEGETEAGGVVLPASVMGLVALDELVIHGWDLARATDQPFVCDRSTAEPLLAFLTRAAEETGGRGTEGMFGPVVPVPEDAPPLDRAVGLAGRDPAWKP